MYEEELNISLQGSLDLFCCTKQSLISVLCPAQSFSVGNPELKNIRRMISSWEMVLNLSLITSFFPLQHLIPIGFVGTHLEPFRWDRIKRINNDEITAVDNELVGKVKSVNIPQSKLIFFHSGCVVLYLLGKSYIVMDQFSSGFWNGKLILVICFRLKSIDS